MEWLLLHKEEAKLHHFALRAWLTPVSSACGSLCSSFRLVTPVSELFLNSATWYTLARFLDFFTKLCHWGIVPGSDDEEFMLCQQPQNSKGISYRYPAKLNIYVSQLCQEYEYTKSSVANKLYLNNGGVSCRALTTEGGLRTSTILDIRPRPERSVNTRKTFWGTVKQSVGSTNFGCVGEMWYMG